MDYISTTAGMYNKSEMGFTHYSIWRNRSDKLWCYQSSFFSKKTEILQDREAKNVDGFRYFTYSMDTFSKNGVKMPYQWKLYYYTHLIT